jgi:hypothetical protein
MTYKEEYINARRRFLYCAWMATYLTLMSPLCDMSKEPDIVRMLYLASSIYIYFIMWTYFDNMEYAKRYIVFDDFLNNEK